MSFSRLTTLALGLTALFAVVAADVADARLGGGRNLGSRGGKTFDAPPATNTAPKAAPIERSMTQKGSPSAAAPAAAPSAAAAQPSRFGGWRGLLMGGLLAAGLAGLFGMGALTQALGFILQFALIGGAIYLAYMFFRSRSQQPAPASAGAAASPAANRTPPRETMLGRNMLGSGGGSAAGNGAITIGQDDLDSFERLLGEIQTAYGREDTDRLGDLTTPEMLSYFSEDLAENAKEGLRDEISNVKLLQGDLSEAWREGGSDYATVAMRFSLVEATVERATGRVVEGDRNTPTEVTELWTFRRDDRTRGDGWQLSAIQQAA